MVLVEIETSFIIKTSICYRTPIWCFHVYEIGRGFPWFSKGELGPHIIKIGSVTINHITYTNAEFETNPMNLPRFYFCQIENMVYVHNDDENPLWLYYLPKANKVIGFNDSAKAFVMDRLYYQAGLSYIPKIADEADSLEYGTLTFKNENVTLINTEGRYDDVTSYFGNNIRVRAEIGGVLKNLYEYYIKNVKIKATETTFVCGDRREKLTQKVPGERFTREEFPKIKEELIGELKQDIYGTCEWVNCICVDELDIYSNEQLEIKKTYRTFYVARKITQLRLFDTRPNQQNYKTNYVWVKMTQNDGDDVEEIWTPQPVREIEPLNPNAPGRLEGFFTINIDRCMPVLWTGYDVPELFEVRACGTFMPQTQPHEILKELLWHYCGLPFNQYTFRLDDDGQYEIDKEIGMLAPIGIVYDEEQSVYEAIEKLHHSSDFGFRFVSDYNRFTVRRDNDMREISDTIRLFDIDAIDEVEIDMNQQNFATIVDIQYNKDYYHEDDNGNKRVNHYKGTTNRPELLVVHGIDKTYTAETYLYNGSDAKHKANYLEHFFRKHRIMISNISVINHPHLRVYDIIMIDLRIPLEKKHELKHISVLFGAPERESVLYGDWKTEHIGLDFEPMGKPQPYRTFGGVLKCKVMSISLDLKTMLNTIELLEVG